jgi:hypothetical protein
MARTLPDGWEALEAAGVAPLEIATLRRLAADIPDDYSVFHGVHWTRVANGYSVFGEIDFIVVGLQGQAVVIEQKNGPLEETPEGLAKRYQDKLKSVSGQMQRSIDALQFRFTQGHSGQRLALDYLLYCPNHRVQSPATAGIAPERIVDARHVDKLATIVVAMLAAQPPSPGVTSAAVHAFLSDELELALDTSALVGQARNWVTRLSGGLATWARRLEFEPFRLRVIGTAGSGKTQLALCILEDAAAKGQARAVCLLQSTVGGSSGAARTGRRQGDDVSYAGRSAPARRGRPPDFQQSGVFETLAAAYIRTRPSPEDLLDVLVIDEGQDFEQAWADALLGYLKPDGKVWWLEDPMQNLYDKPRIDLPGWVTLHADINYRTPRDVLREISRLIDLGGRIEAAGPLEGDGIHIATYSDFAGLKNSTIGALDRARNAGFKKGDIAVLTYCGRERSALKPFDRLGSHTLRRFDGTYDAAGRPVFQDGDILIETVFRFKGQAAPCIILTEIDFETLDQTAMRRLYVGATRASMQLSLVVSDRAARQLLAGVA